MNARILRRALETALFMVGSAGCCAPMFEVRSAGGWDFHVVTAPPHFGKPPVDERGFFDADVCRAACKDATACYPTTVRSPDFPHQPRKVSCAMVLDRPRAGYATEFGHGIEMTPEQEASTIVGPKGEIDPVTCSTLCDSREQRRSNNLDAAHPTSCEADPLPPPVVGADEIFVVCGRYTPPHCANRSVFGS